MHLSRHRPLLSLDANSLRGSTRYEPGLGAPPAVRVGYVVRPEDAYPTQQSGGATEGRFARLKSFVKVSGSLYGADSDKEDSLQNRTSPSFGKVRNEWPGGSPRTNGVPPRSATTDATKLPERHEDSGPLLAYNTRGGAKVTLTLDRHIQYEAATKATSVWNHRNRTPAATSTPYTFTFEQDDPFSDLGERAAVPRSLLCFSLTLEPFQGELGTWAKENFEFLSLQLDFRVTSLTTYSRHQRNMSSPCTTAFKSRGTDYTAGSYHVATAPVVRGFAPSDLISTNFLQDFGPILYQTVHKQGEVPESAILLGSGTEAIKYRNFERRLAQVAKPTMIGTDKFTARACRAMASACPTPASSTFRQASAPFTPFDVEAAEFGTSSIRILVKRDPDAEASWSGRKIQFIILLEHPYGVPSIEARTRLDMTTVRKTLPVPEALPTSGPSSLRKSPRRSNFTIDSFDSGYESTTPRRRPHASHARSMSDTSIRSTSGRSVEDLEQQIRIYPRSDPISVISCGLATVKDTLFQTGVVPKANNMSAPPRSAKPRPDRSNASIKQARTPLTPYLDKPLPSPFNDPFEPVPARPPPQPLHKHSQSVANIPSMYQRTGDFERLAKSGLSGSHGSGSGGSSYSQDSVPTLHKATGSMHVSTPQAPERRPSHQASVGSSWTNYAFSPPPPLPSASRARLVSINLPDAPLMFAEAM